jgi:hypothetical protein
MTTIFHSPVNLPHRQTKYRHLLSGLERRLAAATARRDYSLIAQLNVELAELEAELRGSI